MCVLVSDLVLNSSDIIAVSKEIGNTFSEIPNAETRWDEFAMKLLGDNEDTNIGQIKKNNTDFVDRCSALLKHWKITTEEPRWDQVVAVLKEINLNEPAGKLNEALTSLKDRGSSVKQLPQREVGHTHQPILQSSNSGGIPERIIAWADLGPTERGSNRVSPLKVKGNLLQSLKQ